MAGQVKRPARLQARGRAFWDEITAVFDLDPDELQLLAEVCRTLDELEALSKAVSDGGVTVEGSRGQVRVHPALGEVRSLRVVLSRLLAQLELPDAEGNSSLPSLTSVRAKKASATRWNGFREKWGSGDGPA